MPCEYSELHLPLSERLPVVLYTNVYAPRPQTVWISPQVERVTGYPAAEWTKGLFDAVLHPDDRAAVLAEVEASRAELRPFSLDYRLLHRNRSYIWIHDESVPIFGADGAPQLMQGFFVDITERRDLELQLLHVQRTEALGRLAGEVAHDFNNYLTAVRGHVDLLDGQLPERSELRRHTREIRDATARSQALTRQLLTYARRDEPSNAHLDLAAVVQSFEPLLDKVAGTTIGLSYALDAAPTVADPCQIEQVIVNLVANARDAMPGGGTATVRTSTVEIDDPLVAERLWIRSGRYAELTVTDEGTGIPEALLGRIFEPFFTTKDRGRGTGLGLSIVEKIARRAGGSVDVSSGSGRGSTFRVLLPAA